MPDEWAEPERHFQERLELEGNQSAAIRPGSEFEACWDSSKEAIGAVSALYVRATCKQAVQGVFFEPA